MLEYKTKKLKIVGQILEKLPSNGNDDILLTKDDFKEICLKIVVLYVSHFPRGGRS